MVWPGLIISKSPLICATLRYGEKGEPFKDPLVRAKGEPSFLNHEIKVLRTGETSVGMHKWGDTL